MCRSDPVIVVLHELLRYCDMTALEIAVHLLLPFDFPAELQPGDESLGIKHFVEPRFIRFTYDERSIWITCVLLGKGGQKQSILLPSAAEDWYIADR